jgi:hypothetical protein
MCTTIKEEEVTSHTCVGIITVQNFLSRIYYIQNMLNVDPCPCVGKVTVL